MTTTLAKEDVSQEFLEAVESAVGTGFGAWDMVDPREIVVAVLTAAAASRFDFSTATANERRVRELLERCERAEGEVERLKAAVEMLRRATAAVFDAVDSSAPVSPVEGVAQ